MTGKRDTPRLETPAAQMGQLLISHFLVQGLHVVVELGITDLLAQQPETADELAHATGTHGSSLYRLLRMFASVGVFRQDASDRFALTPLGDTLHAGSSGSVRDLAILRGASAFWQAWGSSGTAF
jgi:hypothetical protein